MTISHYTEHHDAAHGRNRVTFDLTRVQLWLAVISALILIAASAASGVLATAHVVVPPIAMEAIRPALERLAAEDARDAAAIAKVEHDGTVRDAENVQALRQSMGELQAQLRETARVTNELLLQLARDRRR